MKKILPESSFEIRECRVCSSTRLEPAIDLGEQALANNYVKWLNSYVEKYPLNCVFCQECKTLQLGYTVDKKLLFQKYLYNSSTSPVFIRHMQELAQKIKDEYNPGFVVEIGSNDGILLEPLTKLGIDVVGIESAHNLAIDCKYKGFKVVTSWIESPRFAKNFVARNKKADVVVACNVFAHIHNLKTVVRNAKNIMNDDGTMIVEVVHLLEMMRNNTFDMIYHEHFFSWSLLAFIEFARQIDMSVVKVERIPTHGGSLRIFLQKGELVPDQSVAKCLEEEFIARLNEGATFRKLQHTIDGARAHLMKMLYELKSNNKKIVGYGAPAKANTLMSYFDIGQEHLDYIIDDAPMKQGLYTPCNHLQIKPMPDVIEADYILILAWNFADSIIEKVRAQGYKGEFILPFPIPTIL